MAPSRIPKKAAKKLPAEALWEYALRALASRAHSAAELRRKLLQRAESPPEVDSVMAKLREYQLADDRKFSELFASSRLANSGFGRHRVLRDLRARQVSSTVAEQAVAQAFAETDELQLAENFLRRKYRGKDLPAFLKDEKNLAAAYRRLRTGGFSSSAILAVLKRFSSRTEEFDEPASEPPENE